MTNHSRFIGRGTRHTPAYLMLSLLAAALVVATALNWSPAAAQALSTDDTLSSLSVAPKDIIGFAGNRQIYEVGVDSAVATVTVSATANHAGAMLAFDPADADTNAAGHQVDLSAGRNDVTVRVTAEDGATTRAYQVRVNQGVSDDYGWQAGADLDGLKAAGNNEPYGIWSDGTTVWVADNEDDEDNEDDKLYAYQLSDGTRDAGRDLTLPAVNDNPTGIWSDGTTMWVADWTDEKLYAYRLSDGTRDAGQDFALAAENSNPTGIWSDGTTMWVADVFDDKLYAYRLSDGTQRAGRNFNTLAAAGNGEPRGIWSDGATMWVADSSNEKVYAYRMSDGTRDADRDFDTLQEAGNTETRGIWSDGTTMWVANWTDEKIFAYNMPTRTSRPTGTNARLSGLGLSGVTLGEQFDSRGFDYTGSAPRRDNSDDRNGDSQRSLRHGGDQSERRGGRRPHRGPGVVLNRHHC